MSRVLVTGATGFIGRAVTERLLSSGHSVVAAVRQSSGILGLGVKVVEVGNTSAQTDWRQELNKVDVLIHCAGRAHIINEMVTDPLAEFRQINTASTLNLAKQAAEVGVRRFVFISSIKVNGELTVKEAFCPDDIFVPTDPYGLSKYEAEQGLLALVKSTDMEVVIIRPTLVYGSGVKGNFASLLKWIESTVPLPFGAIDNKRSLVALENLVDFIIHCIDHPRAANEIFLISDGEDVSTTELIQKVSNAFGKKAFLLPIPVTWMRFVARVMGKTDVVNRLFGSLQVNSSKSRELLGWEPVITMDEQLKKTVKAYLNEKAR
ncbi:MULTISPECIES: SDR family oxidoreductase [Cycloclasticus]|uniref:NAD dependent epimerase/dehydratase family protein n=1 Tax=Cycloclasticus pugetii TaxID=34068 RepID=A0AB33Z170_9GAMM|nr:MULTISPECIES: SDR family oxidoreductase [Cycloclasticus]ATI02454.1 NAD-dependent epimerase/dehydratase family protein [Cycloclasticus sp. PY97N]EPD12918.1 NAD dependent epimerase/dehydratase family protein [Cycloclasticus pugetii]